MHFLLSIEASLSPPIDMAFTFDYSQTINQAKELENLAPRPEYRAVLSQMEEIRKKELATEEVSL